MEPIQVRVETPSRRYAITLGDGVLNRLQRLLDDAGTPARRFIVSSPLVWRLHGSRLSGLVSAEPILVPDGDTTSLGSAIFAFLAAGTFAGVEEAQDALCPPYSSIEPERQGARLCEELFGHFRTLYYALGRERSEPVALGGVLPALRRVADAARIVS